LREERMMEIKVRAWDTKNKKWIDDFLIQDDGSVCRYGMFETLDPIDNVILMLSTGLRDKHGKEIWEKDRYVWHRGEKLEERGTIGFEQGCFVCISDKTTFTNVVCSMIDYLEVIGHIYEGE
jgi:hypothetical protein